MGSFQLKAKKPKTKPQLIIYVVWARKPDGKETTLRLSTGYKIPPSAWSDSRKEVKAAHHPQAKEINQKLADFRAKVDWIVQDGLERGHRVSTPYIRMRLESEKPVTVGFFEAWREYLEAQEGRITSSTLRNVNGCKVKLEEFQATKRYPLEFDTITTAFYRRWTEYLMRDDKLADSTIARHTKSLKGFMDWAKDMDYHQNLTYKDFSHKAAPIRDAYFALEQQEMNALRQLDLSDSPRLMKVRDQFLFMADTGMRLSDAKAMTARNFPQIDGKHYLVFNVEKTKKHRAKVDVELKDSPSLNRYPLKIVRGLMEQRQEDEPLFPISGQKFNDYLKEVAQLAGLTRSVNLPPRKNSKRSGLLPIHEAITSHCARRTFITIRAQEGWSDRMIMAWTGHLSPAEIDTYIKQSRAYRHELSRQGYELSEQKAKNALDKDA